MRQALADERVRELACRFYGQLIEELRTDPDCYQLVNAGDRAVGNLVEILSTLRRHGADGLNVQSAGSPKGREHAFIAAFITIASRDAAPPGSLTNAFVRRAATQAATRLLQLSPTLVRDVRDGRHTSAEIDDGLFCLVYQMFVADLVTAALTTFISAHLMTTLPFVPEADLTTAIAKALAEHVSEKVISPCSRQSERQGRGSQLEDVAMGLAKSVLERTLDLEDPAG